MNNNDLKELKAFQTHLCYNHRNYICHISCNNCTHVICLTDKNNIYVWGNNNYGQLGLGDTINRNFPTLLNLPNNEKPFLLSCNGGHKSLCITVNDSSYVWGDNSYGQLQLSDSYVVPVFDTKIIRPVLLTRNERIISISGGSNHTAFITESKELYIVGDNTYGQLGIGFELKRVPFPISLTLPNKEEISLLSCGDCNTFLVTKSEKTYLCGHGSKNNQYPILLTFLPNNEKISFLSNGSNHVAFITKNDNTYTWGDNYYGQLGLGDRVNRVSPTPVTLPNNEKILFLSCGNIHIACITKNENCYVWGGNNYGQLGLGDNDSRDSPTLLTLPNNYGLIFIECGAVHTVCITKNENIYVWGYNEYGQLGLGDNDDRLSPTLLNLPNNEKVKLTLNNWSKLMHKYSSNSTKLVIKTILILALRDKKTEKPLYHQSLFYLLPKEIILYIFEFLPLY